MTRRTYFDRSARLTFLGFVIGSLGCGFSTAGQPPVYPVKGKVLFRGKPVTGGVVIYELEGGVSPGTHTAERGGPLRATGRIESDGSFRLIAFPGAEGVPAGTYKVGISSLPPRTEGNLFELAKSATKGNPDVLQGRFADPSKSGLHTQVIDDKPNEPTFDLK
jgi:hypothetical protein